MEFFDKLVQLSLNIKIGSVDKAKYSNEIDQNVALSRNLMRDAILFLETWKKMHLQSIFEDFIDSCEERLSISAKHLPEFLQILNECREAFDELISEDAEENGNEEETRVTEDDDDNAKDEENSEKNVEEADVKDESVDEEEAFIRAVKETLKGSEFEIIEKVEEGKKRVDVEGGAGKKDVAKVKDDDYEAFVKSVKKTLNGFEPEEEAETSGKVAGKSQNKNLRSAEKGGGGDDDDIHAFLRSIKQTLDAYDLEEDEVLEEANAKSPRKNLEYGEFEGSLKGDSHTKSCSQKKKRKQLEDEEFLRSVKENLAKLDTDDSNDSSAYSPSIHSAFPHNNYSSFSNLPTHHGHPSGKASNTPMSDLTNRQPPAAAAEHSTRSILKSALKHRSSSASVHTDLTACRSLNFSNHPTKHSPFNHPSSYTSSTPYFQAKTEASQPLTYNPPLPLNAKTCDKVTFKLTPDYKVISDDSGSLNTSDSYLIKHNLSDNRSFRSNLSYHSDVSFPSNRTSFDNRMDAFHDNRIKNDRHVIKHKTPRPYRSYECLVRKPVHAHDDDDDVFATNPPPTPPKNFKTKSYGALSSRFGFKQYYEKKIKDHKN